MNTKKLNIIRNLSFDIPSLTHAANIIGKCDQRNMSNAQCKALDSLLLKYYDFITTQYKLSGFTNEIIKQRVRLLNEYYDFFDKNINALFSAQGKLRSTIIEEFIFILFKDYLENIKSSLNLTKEIFSGSAKSYTNLYFSAPDFNSFFSEINVKINEKDQDFAIYRGVNMAIDNETFTINVPAIAIEAKTYVDKTMLEGIIATADKLKTGNPYVWFGVVTECWDVDSKVDPAYSRINQIYVLRKCQRRHSGNKPIFEDVIIDLFNDVKNHIERPWSNISQKIETSGKII